MTQYMVLSAEANSSQWKGKVLKSSPVHGKQSCRAVPERNGTGATDSTHGYTSVTYPDTPKNVPY